MSLLQSLGRWLRLDAFPLERYRDRFVERLSVLATLILSPFLVYQLSREEWLLAVVIVFAQVVMLIDGLAARRGTKPPVPYELAGCTLAAAMCVSSWLQGIVALFWAFPIVLLYYMTMRRGTALLLTILLVLAVGLIAGWNVGAPIAARLVASLVFTAIMAGALLNVIEDQQQALERQAITDALTGAFNRRHFDAELSRLEAGGRAFKESTLLSLDIDHFKRINDTHGHAAGDEVLRRVAEEIVARKRLDDVLFRTGGEEFMLLLPGTGAEEALILAESLRKLIEQAQLLPEEPVTVSIGVAAHLPGEGLGEWAKRSDAALYEAKRQGRNRVVSAPGASRASSA